MAPSTDARRPNQKKRTRKDLLQAAARLTKDGRKPSLEEVAEEAMVSRATAYRYFANVEALLVEASLDIATPEADALFGPHASADPIVRMEAVEKALHDMLEANEAQIRMMLVHSLQRDLLTNADNPMPARQNRRAPLIEAALEPAKATFKPAALKNLSRALAVIIGTEAMVVFKDVLQIDDGEARKVRRWAIRALIEAARK
jgi:AcrR family transcriptional regulator